MLRALALAAVTTCDAAAAALVVIVPVNDIEEAFLLIGSHIPLHENIVNLDVSVE